MGILLSNDEVARFLGRTLLPSHLTYAWNKMRSIPDPAPNILAERSNEFALHETQGKIHTLSIRTMLGCGSEHTLIEAAFHHGYRQTNVIFDLNGIGFPAPENPMQAQQVLRCFGNAIHYLTRNGLDLTEMVRELYEWAELTPLEEYDAEKHPEIRAAHTRYFTHDTHDQEGITLPPLPY